MRNGKAIPIASLAVGLAVLAWTVVDVLLVEKSGVQVLFCQLGIYALLLTPLVVFMIWIWIKRKGGC